MSMSSDMLKTSGIIFFDIDNNFVRFDTNYCYYCQRYVGGRSVKIYLMELESKY